MTTPPVRLLGPAPAELAANAPVLAPALALYAACVLRELAAMDLDAAALRAAGRAPPPHEHRALRWAAAVAAVDMSPEVLLPLGVGLVRNVRLHALTPPQLNALAARVDVADAAVAEYLLVVDAFEAARDHGRVISELDLLLGADGCARSLRGARLGPALSWTETLRLIDQLDLSLGRRHRLRFGEPTRNLTLGTHGP